MQTFAIDIKNLTARVFATAALANSLATEEESTVMRVNHLLDDKGCTVIAMTAFYNKFAEQAGVAPRNRFDNRASAAEGVFAVLETLAAKHLLERHEGAPATVHEAGTEPATAEPAAKGRKVRGAAAAATTGAPRAVGKRAMFNGKVLYPTAKALAENGRRHGSEGWACMEVVRAHPQGIVYEEYVKLSNGMGGAHQVKYDIECERVTLENPNHAAPAPVKPAKGKGKTKTVAAAD